MTASITLGSGSKGFSLDDSFTAFSPTARLAFLVVGPMVDLKLIALQGGTFGSSFAVRFAPLTLAVAITSASVVGWVLL